MSYICCAAYPGCVHQMPKKELPCPHCGQNLHLPANATTELASLKSINAGLIEAHDKWRHREADLLAQLEKEREEVQRLRGWQIDDLKVAEMTVDLVKTKEEKTLWKSKAEKLAEALKEVAGIEVASTEWDGYMVLKQARDTAKKSLADFEAKA